MVPKCLLLLTLLFKIISSQRPCNCQQALTNMPIDSTNALCKHLSEAIQSVILSQMKQNAASRPVFGPISQPLIDEIASKLKCNCPVCSSITIPTSNTVNSVPCQSLPPKAVPGVLNGYSNIVTPSCKNSLPSGTPCGCENCVSNVLNPATVPIVQSPCGWSNAVTNVVTSPCGCPNCVSNVVPANNLVNTVKQVVNSPCGCKNVLNTANLVQSPCGCQNCASKVLNAGSVVTSPCGCQNCVSNVLNPANVGPSPCLYSNSMPNTISGLLNTANTLANSVISRSIAPSPIPNTSNRYSELLNIVNGLTNLSCRKPVVV